MMREKDKLLAEQCNKLADIASDAMQWIANNEELIGDKKDELVKQLKKESSEARKISRASQRPNSVGIFGPSQVGKSFLMQGFITETKDEDKTNIEREGRVLFGSDEDQLSLDFLNDVNPQGGMETTGLVTRFTLKRMSSPKGFPVCLRVFKEIDIVKVLANSFVFDLDRDAVNKLSIDSVTSLLEELESVAQEQYVDALTEHDIYELQDYFEHSMNSHALSEGELGELYWDRADWLAPRLKASDRLKLYSLLWGEVPEFAGVFNELKNAIDQLGHPEWVFAPLEAIENNSPGNTILHVLTVKEGLDDPSANQQTQLMTKEGRTVSLRKPAVTAIAFELLAQLEKGVFDFQQSTDLLDFPGARSRTYSNRQKFFIDSGEAHPIGEAFVRGKVAVMFDNYCADYDLNTLIACHKTEKIEVKSFPPLVEDWVKRSHGNTPEARMNKPINLLFAFTWCDVFFDVSVGQKDNVAKFNNLLRIIDDFSQSIKEWTPSAKFNNTYLIRNPAGKLLETIFDVHRIDVDNWVELEIKECSQALLQEYKDAFLATEIAQGYFKQPGETWDEMVRPDDGGITGLARGIAEACSEDVKFNQIQPEAKAIIKSLQQNISPYYEDDDIETRIKQRISKISEVIERLEKHPDLIPSFIGEYQVSQDKIRSVYLDYRRNKQLGVAKSRYAHYESAGQMIVSSWVNSMAKKCNNEHLCEFYSLDSEHMRCIANELQAGTQLVELVEVINDKLEKIEAYVSSATKIADHAATMISTLLNDFVNHLGSKGELKAPAIEYPDDIFRPLIKIDKENHVPIFPERTRDMGDARNEFSRSWLKALAFMTKVNASSSKGTLVNVEENVKLGKILATLGEIA